MSDKYTNGKTRCGIVKDTKDEAFVAQDIN